ncbi:MAG: hypothetical protein N2V78_08020 [Methanophagales archaeon]|nr:hypothetical protein [Methanophagales archaeon]
MDAETITEKAIREFIARYKLEKMRKEMRENVNWEYISKLPGRLQKGLFYLLDTRNLHNSVHFVQKLIKELEVRINEEETDLTSGL